MTRNIIADWFDQLETTLDSEAKLAGLFSHGTLTGSVREFFVKRALSTILPANLRIGSGRVLAPNGELSKQIDVVVYDSSYPALEAIEGQGIYFVDGVIATIEIKSTIDEKELHIALDNCVSVSRLEQSPSGQLNLPPPVTCIFGMTSTFKKTETLSRKIENWWEDRGYSIENFDDLPNVLVAGNLLGLANNKRYFQIGADGELASKISARPGKRIVTMGIWKAASRFSWLLMLILVAASRRGFNSKVGAYLPFEHYWERDLRSRTSTLMSVELE